MRQIRWASLIVIAIPVAVLPENAGHANPDPIYGTCRRKNGKLYLATGHPEGGLRLGLKRKADGGYAADGGLTAWSGSPY